MNERKSDTESKTELRQRFERLYPEHRLLAIQLNGFSHTVFFDNENSNEPIQRERYTCAPEQNDSDRCNALFIDYGHWQYQNDPLEIVWVMPNDR